MNGNARDIRGRKAGFTLIEVLLALTLTTMILTLTGQIAVQSFKSRRQAEHIIARLEREARLLNRIAEDFVNITDPLPGDSTSLLVFGHQRQVLQLTTLSSIPAQETDLHLIIRPATVRYRLIQRLDGGFDLIREVIDRTTPGSDPVRETVASRVASFGVEVLQEDTWVRRYPQDDDLAAKAVRVSCQWSESMRTVSRTFLVPYAE